MMFSPHRRTIRAALALCAALLAGACTPPAPTSGPMPEAATRLEPREWTAQSPAAEIAAWARQGCRRAPGGSDACLERTLVSLTEQAGITKSMEVLDTLATMDGTIRDNAHPLAHGLGISAYRSPETLAATFAGCPNSQMSGCYHGVIQGYFLDLDRQGKPIGRAELDALCEPHKAVMFVYFQCAHGMGHGLMAVHQNNVPMALEACDQAGDEFIRESCYGGVFMENIVGATEPHHTAGGHASTQAAHGDAASGDEHDADEHAGHGGAAPADEHAGHGAAGGAQAMQHGEWKALDRNDWLYPCNAVADRYLTACYMMQTSAVMFFNYGDVGSTAQVCERAPEAYRQACFMSLGRDVTAWAAQEHARTIDLCRRAGNAAGGRGQPWCAAGAVQTLVNQSADPRDGIRFCRAVDGGSKAECYRAVGGVIWALNEDEAARTRHCQTAEAEFVAACRLGAGLEPPRAESGRE
jgi:hypothetical protein